MAPLPALASEGRFNSKGIPVLYLSLNRTTALSEARPWIGELLSVGKFKLSRDIRVVDCSRHSVKEKKIKLLGIEPEQRDDAVWSTIDLFFSRPTVRSDSTADYAPTQILSEVFKFEGFDGVVYRSSLSKGRNIALFEMAAAECIEVRVCETKSVRYEFSRSVQHLAGPRL